MSATIKTTLVDNSKEWADTLKARFMEAGGKAEDFEAHLESLHKELAARDARNAAQDIKKLADEIEAAHPETKRLREETAKLESEFKAFSDDLAEQTKRMESYKNQVRQTGEVKAQSSRSWTEFAAKGAVVLTSLRGLTEGAKKTWQGIKFMSEQGAEGFQALEAAGNRLGASLMNNLKSKEFTQIGKSISLAVEGVATPAIEKLTWGIGKAGAAVSSLVDGFASLGGVDLQKARDEMEATAKAATEAAKLQESMATSRKNAEQVFASYQKASQQIEEQRSIARLETEHEVIAAIKDQEIAVYKLRNAAVLKDGEEQAALAKLVALRQQYYKVIDDRDAKIKQQNEETKKRIEEEKRLKIEAEKKVADEELAQLKKIAEERWKSMMEQVEARQEAEKKAAAERVALEKMEAEAKAANLAKRADAQQGNAQAFVGGMNPQMVARNVAANRQQQAMQDYANQNAAKYLQAKQYVQKHASQMKFGGGTANQKKAYANAQKVMRDMQKAMKAAGTKARRMGFRDTMQGKAGSNELANAQQQMADKVIDNGVATGRINQEQAASLREATKRLIEQQRQLRALEEEVRNTTMQLQQLGGRSANAQQRAQRQF